jgi:diacylglycerol kinase family enzyme
VQDRDKTGPQSGQKPETPPLSNKVAVVVNGNAKSVTEDVIATLDGILSAGDLFVSRHIDEAAAIATMVLDRGYDTVLTGGGDGTFTVMVTAVVREADRRGLPRPRFGLLRLGTGNSLAWVVGASKARGGGLAVDIERLRSDPASRPLRLVEAEGVLSPFCGFGIDAVVLRDYNRTKQFLSRGPLARFAPGAVSYAIASVTQSIPSYLLRPVPHVRVVNRGADAVRVGQRGTHGQRLIQKGETIYEGRARIVCASTIPYYGFGFRMFPYAEDRPDRMQLRISTISATEFVAGFRGIWRGDYENPETIFDYLVENVEVEIDPPTPFQIGGDVIGERSVMPMRLTEEPIRLADFYSPPGS